MENYPLTSIHKKYCKHTEPRILNGLKTCIGCDKIPIPAYKSFEIQRNTYCRNCYAEQNFDPKNLIEPTEDYMLVLENLVINCIYEEIGCKETYKINTLRYLLDHEKGCRFNSCKRSVLKENSVYIDEPERDCFRCDDKYYDAANHDCFSTLLELIEKMAKEIKTLTSWYQEEKTEKLESTIQLRTQIAHLSQKLQSSLEIQNQETHRNTLNQTNQQTFNNKLSTKTTVSRNSSQYSEGN